MMCTIAQKLTFKAIVKRAPVPSRGLLLESSVHKFCNNKSNTKCLLLLLIHFAVLTVFFAMLPWVKSVNQTIRCCAPDLLAQRDSVLTVWQL